MKKILIATAVAASFMTGTVIAAGPTMYGKLHMSVDVMDNGGSGDANYDETSLQTNSSRIGVKGTEDIGNGASVGYLIEWGVDMTGDNSDLTVRNRAVTLSGDWGSFLAGKWDTPMKTLGRKVDLFGDQIGDLRNMTSMNTTVTGNESVRVSTIDKRWDNVIQYQTPSYKGFKATGAYSMDTNTDGVATTAGNSGDNQDNDAFSVNVMYDNGPLMVGLGYESTDANGINNSNADDQTAWRVAASYEVVENLDVVASYTDINNAAFAKNVDTDVSTVGASYTIGANKIKLQYAVRDDFDNIDDSGAKMLAVGVDHAMSKRTSIYAAYAVTDNDDNSGSTPWLGGHDSRAVGALGEDADAFSLGLIHKF